MRRVCPYNYNFSNLFTTFSHNLIKEKLLDLIERIFKRKFEKECTLYLACYDNKAFFTSIDTRAYQLWSHKCMRRFIISLV